MHISTYKIKHIITGIMLLTGSLLRTASFAQAAYNKGPMFIAGTVYLGTSTGGAADFTNTATANYLNNGSFYLTGNFTNDQAGMAAGTPSSSGLITFLGLSTYINGSQDVNFYDMALSKNASTNLLNMLTANVMTLHNLTLTKGVVTTSTHLFTYGNTGTLTTPEPTYTANSLNYTTSFIATCDNLGNPINVAGATTPFTGNAGFKIKNVGNADTYFPVGASYASAGTAGFNQAPDRMMLNNHYGLADFTVVVNYGDIGFTPGGTAPAANRVNRIWYVKTNTVTPVDTGKADMKLFFTKRDWSGGKWPTIENEIESGFDYGQPALVEKDYSGSPNVFIRLANNPTDIKNFASNPTYPYNTEIYGSYTIGYSTDAGGNKNGIGNFYRFSVVNPTGIILPVTIINFKAYQQGSGVQTQWTCVNEKNMNNYEVQHSTNGIDFSSIGSVAALNNGQTSLNYTFYDAHPANGNNFYRVKAIGKDGTVSYTNIDLVNIGGAKSDISIFPNPVTSLNFTLQMTNVPGGKYALIIHNMLGQQIVNKEIERLDGSSSETIYLPQGTARGVYKVSLINGSSKIIKTITVQ